MVAANFRRTHSPSQLAWSEGWRNIISLLFFKSAFCGISSPCYLTSAGKNVAQIEYVTTFFYIYVKYDATRRAALTVWAYAGCTLLTFLRCAHCQADTVGRTEKIFNTVA